MQTRCSCKGSGQCGSSSLQDTSEDDRPAEWPWLQNAFALRKLGLRADMWPCAGTLYSVTSPITTIRTTTDRIYDAGPIILQGKSVPLQARSGPESSRKLMFPDYMIRAQDGCKVVSLTHRPPLPPGNAPGTHFC